MGKPQRHSKDLKVVTEDWPYVPGQISVRRIRGVDNREKLQMRVDLGVLQMETDGRPDGQQPFGKDSLLTHHEERVEAYRRQNGSDLGFALDADECRALRDEAFQYYQRYLANFVLEDYDAVARDTKRNLRALDLCRTYAMDEEDQYHMETYRPYIIMMYTQSMSLLAMQKNAYRTALAHVESGLRSIRDFFRGMDHPEAYRASAEVEVLKQLRRDVRRHLPEDRLRTLRKKLKKAIRQERYEEAAQLRDQLESLRPEEGLSND